MMGCVLDVSTGLVGYVRAGVLGFPSTGQIRDGISHSVLSLPQRQGSKGFQQGLQSAGRFIASWALGDSATCLLLTEC